MKSFSYQDISRYLREGYYKAAPYQVRSLFNARQRESVFRQAFTEFLCDPGACSYPGNAVLTGLIHGWGNEAWSAREEFLAACISRALTTDGPILECGSGLSTLLIAAIAKKQGRGHWVLEHKPSWAEKVRSYLEKYDLDAMICVKPLKDYGDYYWYDAPLERMPAGFSLAVCDGPPRRTKGGRYGLVPVMKDSFQAGCLILLDDGYRREEFEIAKRWAVELNASFTVQGTTKPYIIMTLP